MSEACSVRFAGLKMVLHQKSQSLPASGRTNRQELLVQHAIDASHASHANYAIDAIHAIDAIDAIDAVPAYTVAGRKCR